MAHADISVDPDFQLVKGDFLHIEDIFQVRYKWKESLQELSLFLTIPKMKKLLVVNTKRCLLYRKGWFGFFQYRCAKGTHEMDASVQVLSCVNKPAC